MLAVCFTVLLPSTRGANLQAPLPVSQTTPAHGSVATALPQEGVRLFAKLKRINVRAMEDPDLLQGVVAQEDILRVKKALQKIYLVQDVLPSCTAQTSWIGTYTDIDMRYALYDILTYIYGRHHSLLHRHQGFATYEAAYQHGIRSSHLRTLDAAICDAHNVGTAYLQDVSFYKAFDVLTGGVYRGAMRVPLTCAIPDPNTPAQPSHDHLQRLAPMFRWLKGFSPLYLPKGLQTCILVYAYGKSFPSYGRIGSLKDVLFQKPVTCVCEGKTINAKEIRKMQDMLQHEYIDERFLPYGFVAAYTHRFILAEPSTIRPSMSEYLRFYSLHGLLVHIKETPYLQLVHEGWTRAYGLRVEEALEGRLRHLDTCLALCLNTSRLTLAMGSFGYLLGVFGVFKACQEVVDKL